MAGTGKVPKKEGPGEPEKKGGAGAAAEPADEKIPPLGWMVLAVAVVLMVVGGLMVLMQFFWSGDRTGWLIGGAVLGVGGIAALAYFFDKWGKL